MFHDNYITVKQVASILPWICSATDHKRCQSVERTQPKWSHTTSMFLPHFDVICDLLYNNMESIYLIHHTSDCCIKFSLTHQFQWYLEFSFCALWCPRCHGSLFSFSLEKHLWSPPIGTQKEIRTVLKTYNFLLIHSGINNFYR